MLECLPAIPFEIVARYHALCTSLFSQWSSCRTCCPLW